MFPRWHITRAALRKSKARCPNYPIQLQRALSQLERNTEVIRHCVKIRVKFSNLILCVFCLCGTEILDHTFQPLVFRFY